MPTTVPYQPTNAHYERPTDDLRAVVAGSDFQRDVVTRIQRRWVVQCGPLTDGRKVLPPLDKPGTWINHPDAPLGWMAVRQEWRDLPLVTEAAVRAERAASAATPTLSTDS